MSEAPPALTRQQELSVVLAWLESEHNRFEARYAGVREEKQLVISHFMAYIENRIATVQSEFDALELEAETRLHRLEDLHSRHANTLKEE